MPSQLKLVEDKDVTIGKDYFIIKGIRYDVKPSNYLDNDGYANVIITNTITGEILYSTGYIIINGFSVISKWKFKGEREPMFTMDADLQIIIS